MSPPGSSVFEAGVAVIERNAAIESLVELDFGARKTEAAWLRCDLEAASFPLHDIIVADDAFVSEAADAVQLGRSRTPSLGGIARSASEAAVVVGDETAQDAVGGLQIAGVGQAEFAGEAILEHAPETFDAAVGLRALSGDKGYAELIESAAELSGLAFSGELFIDGPVVIVANEDAAAIAIEGEGNPEAVKQALEQVKIAFGGFGEEELSGEDFTSSVVLHAQSREGGAAAFEPVVRGAIELNKFAFARRAQAALAMSGRAAFAR